MVDFLVLLLILSICNSGWSWQRRCDDGNM